MVSLAPLAGGKTGEQRTINLSVGSCVQIFKDSDSLQYAFYYISKTMKGGTEDTHGFSINYYKFRHTFATLFFYDAMEKADNWDGARWLSDMSIRNELRKRMGHSLLSTTIQNYVESAIFLHIQKNGDSKRWFPDAMAHLDKITAARSRG